MPFFFFQRQKESVSMGPFIKGEEKKIFYFFIFNSYGLD